MFKKNQEKIEGMCNQQWMTGTLWNIDLYLHYIHVKPQSLAIT